MRFSGFVCGGVLFAVSVCAGLGAEPASWGEISPELRLKASFEGGLPEADISAGEKRISRIWMGRDNQRRPEDSSRGRVAAGDCFVEGRGGLPAFAPRSDFALRATGNMNADQGTFASWIRRGQAAEKGGLLFASKTFITGGLRGAVRWGLGYGPLRLEKAGTNLYFRDPETRAVLASTDIPSTPWFEDPEVWNKKGVALLPAGKMFLYTEGGIFILESDTPEDDWFHLAVAWDADVGSKIYINGERVADTIGVQPWPATGAPLGRVHFVGYDEPEAFQDLMIFDAMLNSEAIAGIASGEGAGELAAALEVAPASRELRMRSLGWGEGEDGDLIGVESGKPLTVRQVVVERAFDDMRAAGHLGCDGMRESYWPWWYHGYTFLHPRMLHLVFGGERRYNYVTTRGSLDGVLRDGGSPADREGGAEILRISEKPLNNRHRFAETLSSSSATLVREARWGRISEIGFWEITPGGAGEEGRTFYFYGGAGEEPPLTDDKRSEMITLFRPDERGFVTGLARRGGLGERREVEALKTRHLFSAPMSEDYALGGARLRLWLAGLGGETRMNITVRDPFDMWRELASLDFLIHPASEGPTSVDISLDLRDTILRAGDALWVSFVLDRDAQLLYYPGPSESSMTLLPANADEAGRLWLEWEVASWRDAFEAMSEPRPWAYLNDDPGSVWWLAGSSPQYEHMDRVGREVLRRFPDDSRARAWFNFIHPRMENPTAEMVVPSAGEHPEWAFLARECYIRLHHFADWWSRTRSAPNGELGNFYGDDTDLIQDWPDIAMISDPEGVLRETVRKVADGVWSEWKLSDGRPLHIDGLNTRFKDGLHAYEEGINVQPLALLMDYGNPVLIERLMATCARYDGYLFTGEENGLRRFAGSWWGTNPATPPTHSPHHSYAYLFCHPGLVLMWYNAHPEVRKIFTQTAAWKLSEWDSSVAYGMGGKYFYAGLFLNSGNPDYIKLLQPQLGEAGVCVDPVLASVLPHGMWDREATLEALAADRAERYDELGTTSLGFYEQRYDKGWLEWKLTGDKSHLVDALRALYKRLQFTMPALTLAEQSGDRVSPPKGLISHMYLGGKPAGRMYMYPIFAASYEGLSTNYAALVLEDTPDLLRIMFYNFEPVPQKGLVRTWNLAPGVYRVRTGSDLDGDDVIDVTEREMEMELWRGAEAELDLPVCRPWIWEARRIREARPLHERPDVAISAEDAEWGEDGSLTVRVHNVGCMDVAGLEVALCDARGEELEMRVVESLEAPMDFKPRVAELSFAAGQLAGERELEVRLDPNRRLTEITRANNVARIKFGRKTD